MKHSLEHHILLKLNFKHIKPLLERKSYELIELVEETGEIQKNTETVLDEPEFYYVTVFSQASALLDGIRRLESAKEFIRKFPNPRSYEEKGISQFYWIEYHYSFFIITFNSLFDMALILTNTIFQLGNLERNCKPHIIKDNTHIKNTQVEKSLKKIEKITSTYRSQRNLFIHRGESPNIVKIIDSDTLDMLKLHSSVHITQSKPVVPIETLDLAYKYESEKICSELETEISKVQKAIYNLFTNLYPTYFQNSNSLRKNTREDN
jgi:hypothetical protein